MKSTETEQINRRKKYAKRRKRRALGNILLNLILVIASGVMIYSGYNLYLIFSEYKEGEAEYEGLKQYVQEVITPTPSDDAAVGADMEPTPEPTPETDPETGLPTAPQEVVICPIAVNFEELKKVNSDIVGWIYIEALPKISYPIVQGTDNEFYLRHTVERTPNFSASIFMDYQNSPDFTDTNTIIYGHNMKNQSMFGLLKHLRYQNVYDKSPYIWILTPEGYYRYEVFSACEVAADDQVYTLFSAGGEEFKAYLERMQSKSDVVNDMAFTGEEYIITLSTCTGNDATRCVVQAAWVPN